MVGLLVVMGIPSREMRHLVDELLAAVSKGARVVRWRGSQAVEIPGLPRPIRIAKGGSPDPRDLKTIALELCCELHGRERFDEVRICVSSCVELLKTVFYLAIASAAPS